MQKKFLIIGHATSWSNQELAKEFVNAGHVCEIYDPMDLFPYLGESKTGHSETLGTDRIYFRRKDSEKSEKLILKEFHGVVTRLAGRSATYGRYVSRAFEARNKFVANVADSISRCSDKFFCAQILKRAGVPVPRQMLLYKSKDPKEALEIIDPKPPIICKKISGSLGKGVFVIPDALSGAMVLQSFSDSFLVLQRFLNKNTKEKYSDIRVLVIGAETQKPEIIAYERISENRDPRANFSIHKSGRPVKLNGLEVNYALTAARAMGCGIAGIDLIRDVSGENAAGRSFVIECNSNPSLQGISEVTGVNVARKIVQYVERESERPSKNRPFYENITATTYDQAPATPKNEGLILSELQSLAGATARKAEGQPFGITDREICEKINQIIKLVSDGK